MIVQFSGLHICKIKQINQINLVTGLPNIFFIRFLHLRSGRFEWKRPRKIFWVCIPPEVINMVHSHLLNWQEYLSNENCPSAARIVHFKASLQFPFVFGDFCWKSKLAEVAASVQAAIVDTDKAFVTLTSDVPTSLWLAQSQNTVLGEISETILLLSKLAKFSYTSWADMEG